DQLLNDCLKARETSSIEGDSHQRAILQPRKSADQYLRDTHSRDHRKDLRRKGRRFSELGRLEYNSLEPGGDIDAWIEEFLQLEAAGWKGSDGGAFSCTEANLNYFVSISKA